MLILDVRTRWSSTHQMMRKLIDDVTSTFVDHDTGRALDFLNQIDDFIFQNEDLSNLALTEAEWESITPASSVTYAMMNKGSDGAFGPYKMPETISRTCCCQQLSWAQIGNSSLAQPGQGSITYYYY